MTKKLCLVLGCSALTAAVISAQVQKGEGRATRKAASPTAPSAATLPPSAGSVLTTVAEPDSTASALAPPASPPAPTSSNETGRRERLLSSEIGGRDLLFLTTALENGQVQLYLGELAKTKAGTEQVKAVGEVLASTQAAENERLAQLSALKGITLDDDGATSTKALSARLGKLSGPKFDKALMEEIIQASEQAVSTYEAAAQTKDREIKAFVEQGLPLAKEKLMLANQMTGNKPRSDQRPGFRAQVDAPKTE